MDHLPPTHPASPFRPKGELCLKSKAEPSCVLSSYDSLLRHSFHPPLCLFFHKHDQILHIDERSASGNPAEQSRILGPGHQFNISNRLDASTACSCSSVVRWSGVWLFLPCIPHGRKPAAVPILEIRHSPPPAPAWDPRRRAARDNQDL